MPCLVVHHAERGNDAFAPLLGKIAVDPLPDIRTLAEPSKGERLPFYHASRLLHNCHTSIGRVRKYKDLRYLTAIFIYNLYDPSIASVDPPGKGLPPTRTLPAVARAAP